MYFTETTDFIFSKIGIRTKNKKEKLCITYYQLSGYENKSSFEQQKAINAFEKYDISIIKSIASGKAYKKKNPNLIPDRYISRLTKMLEFKDDIELLWGDFKDEVFIKQIFQKILRDILYSDDLEIKELVNKVLIDFVPYAKYFSYQEMFFENKFPVGKFLYSDFNIPLFFYGIKEDDVREMIQSNQNGAINYLFDKSQSEFRKVFYDFVLSTGKSFSKLNNKLNSFVKHDLLVILNALLPDENSLGLRVHDLMISDWKSLGVLISKEMADIEKSNQDKIEKLLIEFSMEYISKLEIIQKARIELDYKSSYQKN